MDIELRVNRVSTHSVERKVTHEGEEAVAVVPELQVELHDETGHHGSLTLHFFSQASIAAAKDLFGDASMVKASFTKSETLATVDTDVGSDNHPDPDPA